jgi:hypothetical protein
MIERNRIKPYGFEALPRIMERRVEPGNDAVATYRACL